MFYKFTKIVYLVNINFFRWFNLFTALLLFILEPITLLFRVSTNIMASVYDYDSNPESDPETDTPQHVFDFDAAAEMLAEAAKVTKLPNAPLRLLSNLRPDDLSGCTDLSFNGQQLTFRDSDGREMVIQFEPHPDCCENVQTHFDGKSWRDHRDQWHDLLEDLAEDVTFSIRVLHFTSKSDDPDHQGGKVVVDFAVGDTFDKTKIVHRFVHQNYHNGYYCHMLRFVRQRSDCIDGLQFCL